MSTAASNENERGGRGFGYVALIGLTLVGIATTLFYGSGLREPFTDPYGGVFYPDLGITLSRQTLIVGTLAGVVATTIGALGVASGRANN